MEEDQDMSAGCYSFDKSASTEGDAPILSRYDTDLRQKANFISLNSVTFNLIHSGKSNFRFKAQWEKWNVRKLFKVNFYRLFRSSFSIDWCKCEFHHKAAPLLFISRHWSSSKISQHQCIRVWSWIISGSHSQILLKPACSGFMKRFQY